MFSFRDSRKERLDSLATHLKLEYTDEDWESKNERYVFLEAFLTLLEKDKALFKAEFVFSRSGDILTVGAYANLETDFKHLEISNKPLTWVERLKLAYRFFKTLNNNNTSKQYRTMEAGVKFNPQYLESIAKVCHQANKAFCETNGDDSQKNWAEAEEWQRESAVKGVAFRINNPTAGHDAQHNSWMAEKVAEGWVYGAVKDAEVKTHPCIVAFEELPKFQQMKDGLFCAIVDTLK